MQIETLGFFQTFISHTSIFVEVKQTETPSSSSENQGKYEEAGRAYRRSLAIDQKAFCSASLKVAAASTRLARLLVKQVRLREYFGAKID